MLLAVTFDITVQLNWQTTNHTIPFNWPFSAQTRVFTVYKWLTTYVHLTLKMTSTQLVQMPVTCNSLLRTSLTVRTKDFIKVYLSCIQISCFFQTKAKLRNTYMVFKIFSSLKVFFPSNPHSYPGLNLMNKEKDPKLHSTQTLSNLKTNHRKK